MVGFVLVDSKGAESTKEAGCTNAEGRFNAAGLRETVRRGGRCDTAGALELVTVLRWLVVELLACVRISVVGTVV